MGKHSAPVEGAKMELRPYTVTVNGTRTTLLLTDRDAAARGLLPAPEPEVEVKPAPTPANKSRRPSRKAVTSRGPASAS